MQYMQMAIGKKQMARHYYTLKKKMHSKHCNMARKLFAVQKLSEIKTAAIPAALIIKDIVCFRVFCTRLFCKAKIIR